MKSFLIIAILSVGFPLVPAEQIKLHMKVDFRKLVRDDYNGGFGHDGTMIVSCTWDSTDPSANVIRFRPTPGISATQYDNESQQNLFNYLHSNPMVLPIEIYLGFREYTPEDTMWHKKGRQVTFDQTETWMCGADEKGPYIAKKCTKVIIVDTS